MNCGTYGRMARHGLSGVEDYKIFASNPIARSEHPFSLEDRTDEKIIPMRGDYFGEKNSDLKETLREAGTLAFLVIQDDAILVEDYFNGHTRESLSMAFSMSKSVVGLLVGCAIDDGLIGSVEDSVRLYIPELPTGELDQLKLRHLLQMTSGLDYVEADNPFGLHSQLYYCENCIEPEALGFGLDEPPGTQYIYKSGDNILLALALRRALPNETLTQYLERRIWKPMGMESDALWVTDGTWEKSWCGLTATARDYAKIGMLCLNGGMWRGERIVSEEWIKRFAGADTSEGASWEYQYSWWHPFDDRPHIMMAGHLGQYVYVNPETRTVVVRLGTSVGGHNFEEWQEFLEGVSDSVIKTSR